MGRLKPKYLLAALLASGCTPDAPVTDLSQETLADAAELCELVRTDYAYYPDRQENWEAACAGFAGMLGPVTTKPEQLRALETLVDVRYAFRHVAACRAVRVRLLARR
jgi:carboxyl-terminal processing protease